MVVIQKIDHRVRKERKLFFSLKIIPFFVLFMIILLLIFNNTVQKNKDISGNVVNTVTLTQTEYNSSDALEGSIGITFNQNDFLPLNTSVLISLAGECPAYYVCEDGSEVLWKDENCVEVDNEPWACDGGKQIYNCSGSRGHGKTCCASSGVIGKNYINLKCPNVPDYLSSDGTGLCGDSCSSGFKKNLSYFIGKSTSSGKGNFTESTYKNNGNTTPFLGASGSGVGYCFNTTGPSYNPYTSPTCNDSDGNASWIKGTCVDGAGSYTDYCVYNNLFEEYCKQDIVEYNCSACTSPFCYKILTFNEGWYANCTGESKPRLITYAACHSLDPPIYAPKCMMPLKMGWALMPYCALEEMPCSGTCSGGACDLGLGNCSGWNNVYEASFRSLGVSAPSSGGTYFLILALGWNNRVFNSTYSELAVFSSHKECVNNVCKSVEGPGDDQCGSTYDCVNNNCTTNWSCTDFGSCVNGQQYRTCTDLNNCGRNTGKPAEQQACSCSPVWNCAWQVCNKGSVQNKVCSDSMNCYPNNLSYSSESRTCCVEEWDCEKWSKCLNELQTRTCSETTNCGTSFNNPSEQQSCKSSGNFPWVIMIIVVLIIIIGVLIWLIFLKKKIVRDRFVAGSEGGNFESYEPSNPSYPGSSEPTSFEPRMEQQRPMQSKQVEPTRSISRSTKTQSVSSSDSNYGPALNSGSYPSSKRPRRRVVRKKQKVEEASYDNSEAYA